MVCLSSVQSWTCRHFSLLFVKNILLESITSYHGFKYKNHSKALLTGYRSKHLTLAVGRSRTVLPPRKPLLWVGLAVTSPYLCLCPPSFPALLPALCLPDLKVLGKPDNRLVTPGDFPPIFSWQALASEQLCTSFRARCLDCETDGLLKGQRSFQRRSALGHVLSLCLKVEDI